MPERNASEHAQLYAKELRLSLRNNSGAYGYSVMITGSMTVMSAVGESPTVAKVVLFLLGALLSFGTVEAIATRGFRRSLRETEPGTVVALGSTLSFVSVTLAVATAGLCSAAVPGSVGWMAGSFAASLTYLLVAGLEMILARYIEQARGVARDDG